MGECAVETLTQRTRVAVVLTHRGVVDNPCVFAGDAAKPSPLKLYFTMSVNVRLIVLSLLAGVSLSSVVGQETPVSLEMAKDQGRQKSRFLKPGAGNEKPADALPNANVADFQKLVQPLLVKSCAGCHGEKKSEGRLRLDKLNADLVKGADVERWREIYNALIKGEMPPDDSKEAPLTEEARGVIVQWLGEEMHKASVVRRGNKDQSSFRRLTKYEYNYALQDLLGLDFSFADKLPPDTASEDGFRNRSDLLQMSAMQFQSYREIGLSALKRAVVVGERPKPVTYVISMRDQMKTALAAKDAKRFERGDENAKKYVNAQHLLDRETGTGVQIPQGQSQPTETVPFGEASPVSPVVWVIPASGEIKLNLDRFLPDDGVMRVRIRAGRSSMHSDEYAGLRLIFSAHTSNNANFSQTISTQDVPVTVSAEHPEFVHFDISLSDIQRNPFRKLATTFPRRDEFLHIRNISNAFNGSERMKVMVDQVEITAPYYEQWPPKSHTNIFFESPNRADEQVYGREVVGRFLRRVWRRTVAPDEVAAFMGLFAKYRPAFSTFEEAMVEVLATALATPEFLYLTPRPAPSEVDRAGNRIDAFELANRLAVFLWASLPDEELISQAESGALRRPDTMRAQVKRMLADPRSKRFSQQFVGQWLGLDRMNSVTHIKDVSLMDAMLAEPVAVFEEVLRNNGSVMDFLNSDYAVVNERLAAHYGIPKVYGPHFRRVEVEPRHGRGGLLTCAAMLAINSDGKDSHPVKRGVWLLQRMLHDPPPPPPPNVPEVDLTDPEILKMTLKERIVNHRNQPACASCHSRIDPWGIAFENFDALGVYRAQVNGRPVDASSELFNRQKLAGVDGLKRYLLMERQDQFAQAMVHKLTAYALGRSLGFGDRSDIEGLTLQLRRQGDRLVDLIQLIVASDIFNAKQ